MTRKKVKNLHSVHDKQKNLFCWVPVWQVLSVMLRDGGVWERTQMHRVVEVKKGFI